MPQSTSDDPVARTVASLRGQRVALHRHAAKAERIAAERRARIALIDRQLAALMRAADEADAE